MHILTSITRIAAYISRFRFRKWAENPIELQEKTFNKLVKSARNTGAKIVGPIPLPTDKTVYTVLRSPHVDKKSQDQFEMRVHKRVIDIVNPTPQTTNALKKLSLPAGVHVEIKV